MSTVVNISVPRVEQQCLRHDMLDSVQKIATENTPHHLQLIPGVGTIFAHRILRTIDDI